jgi:N-acetylglutamate synthase-like GNAT family acetyltransferase|nr:N-acetylglutamate synthase and related acetyltransferases (ArgA) [uncultured Mediterranean phage uvMED]
MTSVHLYQAEKKDIQDLHDLLKEYKEKDLTDLKFPEVDTVKLNQYLNNFLKVGKIICIKDLDRDKIVGCCIFNKSEYWFSKSKIMIIQMLYIQHRFRNYKLVKQLIDMIKKVADDNPIVLSITSKLDIDPVFERLGFENMGSNWRLM